MADPKIAPQYTREIPLNGRLRTAEDPCCIGASDYQVLQNMRYTDTHIKGIGGTTKINATAVSNVQIKNGIFFRKDQVAENFALVQAYNASSAAPAIYSCSAAPPATGSFSLLYTQSSAAGDARFSTAPGDRIVVCDTKEALIYGGSEMQAAGFIDYDPNGTYKYDFTNMVTNSLTGSDYIATLHRVSGSVDSATMLLLHLDATALDSSPTTPHNMGPVGVTWPTTGGKFASAAYFNGSAYISAASGADFDLSDGVWTIDFQLKHESSSLPQVLWYHSSGVGEYMQIYKEPYTIGESIYPVQYRIGFEIVSASACIASAECSIPLDANYAHIELVENGDDYRLFANGSVVAYLNTTARPELYGDELYIGANSAGASGLVGHLDEFRMSNSARHTIDFDPPTKAYGEDNLTSIYIGSPLPLDGIKFYIGTANTATGSASVFYWNGYSWDSVTNLSEGTADSGVSLAKTGTMSFDSTDAVAKLKMVDDVSLYWHKVEITNVDTTTTVTHVTLSSPMQSIKDLWDGDYRSILSFQTYKASAFKDFTSHVLEDKYESTNIGTWADISSMPASGGYLYAGFDERMQGIHFTNVAASGNTADSLMSIEYFNGGDPDEDSGWTALSITDQTVDEDKTLTKSGIVTWHPPSVTSEFKTYIVGPGGTKTTRKDTDTEGGESFTSTKVVESLPGNVLPKVSLYYYRIKFSANLSTNVALSYVAGIPAQENIRGYKFSVHHADRLWLCNNVDAEPNVVICSNANTSQVFNGEDSAKLYLGGSEGLVAGVSLYSRWGSNTHNMLVMCKLAETYAIVGDKPEDFIVYRISDKSGCVAPMSMVTVSVGEGEVPGAPRNFAVWQSNHGIVAFDGTNITTISDDIADKFDPRSSTAINPDYLNMSYGFYDPVYHEYHFLCVGPGASAINEEWVFDLKRRKWWQAIRPAANRLTCGFPVRDTVGNTYMYAGDNTGFVHRLEHGNDMTDAGITSVFQIGDVALHKGTIMENTAIDWSVLVAMAKVSATGVIAATHYGDAITTGTSMNTVDPTKSGYRIVNVPIHTKTGHRTFHSVKFEMTTNDETVGFEPMFYGITYRTFRREA